MDTLNVTQYQLTGNSKQSSRSASPSRADQSKKKNLKNFSWKNINHFTYSS